MNGELLPTAGLTTCEFQCITSNSGGLRRIYNMRCKIASNQAEFCDIFRRQTRRVAFTPATLCPTRKTAPSRGLGHPERVQIIQKLRFGSGARASLRALRSAPPVERRSNLPNRDHKCGFNPAAR